MAGQIRILVADDHTLFRSGIVSLLDDVSQIIVVGEAENGEDLLRKYFLMNPDIILTDISMPLLSGTEAIQNIYERDTSVKALFLSMYDTEEYIYYCLKSGGLGLVSKNILKEELVHAIMLVSAGKKYFGKDWDEDKLKKLVEKFENTSTVKNNGSKTLLSPRERETLKLISEGLTSSEIAEKMKLSKRTVDTHRTHLMQKLNMDSLSELIKYALTIFE